MHVCAHVCVCMCACACVRVRACMRLHVFLCAHWLFSVDWARLLNTLSDSLDTPGQCSSLQMQLSLPEKFLKRMKIKHGHDHSAVADELFQKWLSRVPTLSDNELEKKLAKTFTSMMKRGDLTDEMNHLLQVREAPASFSVFFSLSCAFFKFVFND